jgi:hypothetical protein
MALKKLATETMIFVSDRWLHDADVNALWKQAPEAAGLLPHIERAHQDLVAVQQSVVDESAEKIKELRQQTADVDKEHDRLIRAIFWILSGLNEAASTPEEGVPFLRLRNLLFPLGLAETKRSYFEEIGQAKSARDRLTHEHVTLLRSIPLPNKEKLSKLVDQWQTMAEKLSALVQQIDTLEKESSADTQKVRPIDILRARNQWIRTVHALRSSLELTTSLNDTEQQRLVGLLNKAEAQADKRSHAVGTTSLPTDTEAPIAPNNESGTTDDGSLPAEFTG